jgi:hypothetical protein
MGADAIAGFAQAGADTGAAVTELVSSIYELRAATKAQDQAYKLAQQQRGDILQQNRITNRLAQDRLGLDQNGLSFAKRKWKNEFMFTQQQYEDQKKMAETNMKRQDIQQALTNLMGTQQASEGQKNTAVSRLGV